MNHIHASAAIGPDSTIGIGSVISADVVIGANCQVGHYCVIHSGARIGDGCQIGDHVVIHAGTHVGDAVRIDEHASVGKQPMRAPNSAVTKERALAPANLGDRCLLGAGAVVYAGCVLGEKVLVADLATVREDVTIGSFTIVGRGVAIENHCSIGAYCKLETNVYITAYSVLEDRVFVAPGTLTSNDNYMGRTEERFKHFKGVTIRKGGRLGVGSVILPGRVIEADAVVAAGALMTKDAAAGQMHAGVPARPFKAVPDEQLLDNQGWD
ncbi:MAG: UDP-2-acetamido-3-amino-2,3-dideoxy-glucuronate N-acetyltransferase [Rhodothermales bacterium]|jgi:UDP-2-acetamido-3-amino-2,3-dideoxy-glucuronate N-acetyltransferase